jgi:cell division protein FtsI (penicillin-binding protein 3)
MHIASFAGFAPVNNPVIAVAVVLDSPKGAYYGASVSAPVFAEVAQQVLEYLGVPHDIDLRPSTAAKHAAHVAEDDAPQSEEDIKALYDAANDLPSDDPLSAAQPQPAPTASAANQNASPPANTPAGPVQALSQPSGKGPSGQQSSAQSASPSTQPPAKTITLPDAARIRVPSLIGLPVRQVIEQAAAAGLEVQIVGNGTSRQQAPDPGAMVPPGTKIVVRCGK